MITPINNHVIIDPVKHEEFMSSVKETFDEVGVVVLAPGGIDLPTGSKVYFDSWMCSKFPKGNGENYWLVPYENIKAYDTQD